MESQKLSDVSVEVCATLPEMRECVSLQRRIWNDPDEDLIPATMLIVAHKVGGQVLLAREDGRPVGFALAIPAFHGELRYLHSHIAGVLPGYQNRGLVQGACGGHNADGVDLRSDGGSQRLFQHREDGRSNR
jgi:predicted GNAT superfamily acetyltransferase